MDTVRDGFGSRFGTVAAMAGSAIGFGNLLRFPYQLGTQGGAAFLFVYLLFVVLLGMTGMMCEMTIGRRSQCNVVHAFKKLAPNSPWRFAGIIGIFTVIVILASYIVLFGWSFSYLVMAVTNQFSGKTAAQISSMYNATVEGSLMPIIYSFICMGITAFIVIGGVKKGIERCAKYCMPILFLILIIFAIRGLTLPGASKGLAFMFIPDFSAIDGNVIFKAMGQGLFDLSLGSGIMITYGSYVNKKENLGIVVAQAACLNTFISLMAGLAIMTTLFAYGVKPVAGFGLSYIVLPNLFQSMDGGYIFGVLFYALLCMAGLTTTISIIEVVVAYLSENFKMSRKKATLISAGFIGLLSIPVALSSGVFKNVTLIGGMNIMNSFDYVSCNLCNPLASLLWVTFAAWYLGYHKVKDELTSGGQVSAPYFPIFINIVKYVSPIVIAIVFVGGLGFF